MDDVNNQKGVLLALSSSAFIGLSFIVKKKGLVRARSSGSGAGAFGAARGMLTRAINKRRGDGSSRRRPRVPERAAVVDWPADKWGPAGAVALALPSLLLRG